MTRYEELVKALRHCADRSRMDCSGCEYEPDYPCREKLIMDAAAAIEALEAENMDLIYERDKLKMRCDDLVGELAAEQDGRKFLMPKRGEWVEHGEPPMLVIECSVCGQKYFNHALQEKGKYCSMCGAKMEVQE